MALSFKEQFATYWDTQEEKERYARVKLSTGDKQKDGTYINTNWFATFVGKAFEKLGQLETKDKIKISGKVSNPYNKEKKTSYLNLVVFDFEFSDVAKNTPKSDNDELGDGVDDSEMPF
jgi:hypothetical protein